MQKMKLVWRRIRQALQKIHLVDKCLLLIMFLLLAQSTYILLINGGDTAETNHVDVIVRTAAASIFGYFLSANFVQRGAAAKHRGGEPGEAPERRDKGGRDAVPQSASGPASADGLAEWESQKLGEELPSKQEQVPDCGCLQIITATSIAVFCLLALIFVRDFASSGGTENASATAVISQFRDFVSGCVGFLIGCPPPKAKDK